MKSKFSIVVLRQFFCVAALTTPLLFTFEAARAQTTNNSAARPRAILLAEWTNTDQPLSQAKAIHARRRRCSLVRGRIANNFAFLKPTSLEEQAFALVNKERFWQKLELLEWDLEMLYLARQHSENMARLNFFSHAGRDGKMVDERANEVGVTNWNSIGENIAFNQGFKNNVEIAIQSWINSLSHKQNLLSRNWLRSGIGIAETSDGKFYITQVFRD